MDKIDDGDALNLSTGIYTSFKQFARMAAEECGYEPEVIGLSDKPSGVFARGGDTAKQEEFGFEYSVDFRKGIRIALSLYEGNS
jgi:GDP-L-fucose synthase